jgi:hypothetical protein
MLNHTQKKQRNGQEKKKKKKKQGVCHNVAFAIYIKKYRKAKK